MYCVSSMSAGGKSRSVTTVDSPGASGATSSAVAALIQPVALAGRPTRSGPVDEPPSFVTVNSTNVCSPRRIAARSS